MLFIISAEEFLLEDIRNYTYLTNGHMPVGGIDDVLEFRSTVEAMTIMGINADDQSGGHANLRYLHLSYNG